MALHGQMLADGVRSRVAALVPAGDRASALDVEVLTLRRFGPRSWDAVRSAARGVDLVVAHGSSTLMACATSLVGLDVPFVYVSIGDPRHWAPSGLRRLRVAALLRRAARVVAICEPARQVLLQHYGLPDSQVVTIPNGRSGRRFRPWSADERLVGRRRLGLPADAPVLGLVGALRPEKRPDVAVRAVAAMPDVHLVVVGDGPDRGGLERLAGELVPGRVHVVGATDAVEDVLGVIDVIVVSSDSEGVPGVLIEAGLCGVPAVATDVGWVDEVVVDGVTGALVPPDRPDLLAVAAGSVLADRDRLGRAALAHCRATFELTVVARRWEQLVLDVRSDAEVHVPD